MIIRTAKILFLICILSISNFGQIKSVSGGAKLGLGEIRGNSPSVSALGMGLYLDFVPWFSDELSFRTGFQYAQKLEYFLPENRMQRYYPFIKSFSFEGVLKVELNKLFFLEQGVGIIYLNDRTFSDVNEWEPGAVFHVLSGIDFSDEESDGIRLGLGLEYGITFTKTNASYYLIYLQIQKMLF
jgi:hypothetical protein